MKNILLIGFPGCGKSTIGKKLAAKFNFQHIDLDDAFEAKYHIGIPAFFSKYGENAFRTCEREVLMETLNLDNVIISSGGGTPCFNDNMDMMKQKALVIYVSMSNKMLFSRLVNAKRIRPLVAKHTPEELQEYIAQTMAIRRPFYEQAHLTINGESPNIEHFIQIILNFHPQISDEYALNNAN